MVICDDKVRWYMYAALKYDVFAKMRFYEALNCRGRVSRNCYDSLYGGLRQIAMVTSDGKLKWVSAAHFRTDALFDSNGHVNMLRPDAPYNDGLKNTVHGITDINFTMLRQDAPFILRPDAPFIMRPDAPFIMRPDAPFIIALKSVYCKGSTIAL